MVIPSIIKLILGIIAASAGVIASVLGGPLAVNIVYAITRRGKKPAPRPKRIWTIFYSSIIVFVVLSTVIAVFPSETRVEAAQYPSAELPTPVLSSVKWDAGALTALDENEKVLWKVKVSGLIQKAIVDDLDLDSKPEVIVGVSESDKNVRRPGKDTGKVIVYNSNGKVKWEVPLGKSAPYAANVGGATGSVVVVDFIVDHLVDDSHKEIIVLTRDLMYYPSKITILSSNGTIGSEYWHPGFIYQVMTARDHETETAYIVARAVNNDIKQLHSEYGNYNPSSVFVFDPNSVSGQAPPYIFQWIEKGTQLWYAILDPVDSITNIQVRASLQGTDEIVFDTRKGYSFYLDLLSGKVKRIGVGLNGAEGDAPELRYFK